MALRKAIGKVKDQTSIGVAKVTSTTAPDLEVAVVKATSHEEDPPDEKQVRFISSLISRSSGYVYAFVVAISKRLRKTRDWIVALKSLMLVDRLLIEGYELFMKEIWGYSRKGIRVLNLGGFRDEAHSSSWDHSAFVRAYALYLDEKVEYLMLESKVRCGREMEEGYGTRRTRSYSYSDVNVNVNSSEGSKGMTPLKEMALEGIFARMRQLGRLLDRFLACRSTGLAKNCRMVLIALYPVVRESFQMYADICEVLAVLLDRFFDMEYEGCVKAFEAYVSTAKQIDDLIVFYGWCKDVGVGRSSEYPDVQRISAKLLESLEEYVRYRSKPPKSSDKVQEATTPGAEEEEHVLDMNETKALPAPEDFLPPQPPAPEPAEAQAPQVAGDLVDLRDEAVSADDQQGNMLALALFAEPSANGSWEPDATSAWQSPAADPRKADWELALVESASNLAKQKLALGGGLDPLLLNGMYDQGIVRQHINTAQLTGGSASSVALPNSKTSTHILALPSLDGSIQPINQDPFIASLTIPPPSYVQMADMEKKQVLLTQEQLLWQQYAREGMQGLATLAKLSGQTHYYGHAPTPVMPTRYF